MPNFNLKSWQLPNTFRPRQQRERRTHLKQRHHNRKHYRKKAKRTVSFPKNWPNGYSKKKKKKKKRKENPGHTCKDTQWTIAEAPPCYLFMFQCNCNNKSINTVDICSCKPRVARQWPRDGFFYLSLTPIIDSISCISFISERGH